MKQARYLGMAPGDLDGKPYAKYWNPEMGPLQEPVQRALLEGPVASELGFPAADASRLLEPGYLPLENGYTRLEGGQIFAAILTQMPRVEKGMLDWWFGWHYMETERYKLWHPRAHLLNAGEKMIGDDAELTDRQKYVGNKSYVSEYIGAAAVDIEIRFSDPAELLDTSRFEEAGVDTAICATVSLANAPVVFGILIHLLRKTDRGHEMRSRFWLGQIEVQGVPGAGFLNKFAGSKLVAKRAVSIDQGRDMVVHCASEMAHLAGFLPDLYADYHPGA